MSFFHRKISQKKRSFRLFLLLMKARWEQGGHPKCHQFNENSREVFKLHSLFNKWEQKEKICDGCPIVSIIHWVWDPIIVLISMRKMERQQNNCTVLSKGLVLHQCFHHLDTILPLNHCSWWSVCRLESVIASIYVTTAGVRQLVRATCWTKFLTNL